VFEKLRGEDLNHDDRVFLGSPDDLVHRIGRARDEMGIDFLLMEVAQGRAPPKKVRDCLTLFGREVIPHLQHTKRARTPALAS
jgi:hypothetical protein